MTWEPQLASTEPQVLLKNKKCQPEARAEPRRPHGKLRWVGLGALTVAIVVAGTGIFRRHEQYAQVQQWTSAEAIPIVSVVSPTRDGSGVRVVLPGDIQAWFDAPIFARVNGYLKNWYFDYGAHVKAGDLLAEIDAPDLDGRYAAAKAKLAATDADVKVRQAEMDYAKTTFDRWRNSPKGVVSIQETEDKKGAYLSAVARYNAAVAEVNAQKGEVDRLEALEGFKRITAPFDGVVTERNTDIGALINAGSGVGGGSGPVLFRVADVHKMRIFVQVPQQMSADIRPGLTAELHLPQYPDKTFMASVATTARAINMSARTLLVELHAANVDNLLQPGSYAKVHFNLPGDPEMVRVPTSALIFREHGAKVAVIGPENKIELKTIKLGRNLGTEFEVLKGVTPSDCVVISPPDSLVAGDLVRIADATVPGAKPAEPGAASTKSCGSGQAPGAKAAGATKDMPDETDETDAIDKGPANNAASGD